MVEVLEMEILVLLIMGIITLFISFFDRDSGKNMAKWTLGVFILFTILDLLFASKLFPSGN